MLLLHFFITVVHYLNDLPKTDLYSIWFCRKSETVNMNSHFKMNSIYDDVLLLFILLLWSCICLFHSYCYSISILFFSTLVVILTVIWKLSYSIALLLSFFLSFGSWIILLHSCYPFSSHFVLSCFSVAPLCVIRLPVIWYFLVAFSLFMSIILTLSNTLNTILYTILYLETFSWGLWGFLWI